MLVDCCNCVIVVLLFVSGIMLVEICVVIVDVFEFDV